jgi:hypothetical protein
VWVPGIIATPSPAAVSMTASSTTGDTRNRAPASTAARASSGVRTVPAPTTIPGRLENSPMRSSAPGVVRVNSMTLKPARSAASMAGVAAPSSAVRRMAEALWDPKNWTNSSGCMGGGLLVIAYLRGTSPVCRM